jgi:hypothetical protein
MTAWAKGWGRSDRTRSRTGATQEIMLSRPDRGSALNLHVGQAVGFAATSYAATALNFVQGIALARILGPQRFGVWLALQLLLTYGCNYHLGVVDSVHR